MSRSSRALRAGLVASLVVLGAGAPSPTPRAGAQPAPVLTLVPQPIGATARLLQTRGAEAGSEDAELPLPVEGLVPARADEVASRQVSVLRAERLGAPQPLVRDSFDVYRGQQLQREATTKAERTPSRTKETSSGMQKAMEEAERRARLQREKERIEAREREKRDERARQDEARRKKLAEEERRKKLEEENQKSEDPPPSGGRTSAGSARMGRPEQQLRAYEMLEKQYRDLALMREERQARREAELAAAKDVQGPSVLRSVNLLEGLHVDREVKLRPSDVLRIHYEVFGDENPATGYFYFVPARYDLAWDPRGQYEMTTIYGMAGQASAEGEVFMAARLQSGVDAVELAVVRRLLAAYARRHSGEDGIVRVRELRPLPLMASSDVALFGGASNEFTVAADAINVQGITDSLAAMDVSWATDVRRLLNLESLLRTGAGIRGSITFHARGEVAFERSIPLEIDVASPDTFGRIPFDRGAGFSNGTYYPLQLHYLHALVIHPRGGGGIQRHDPVVYSWSLTDASLAPGAQVRWNAWTVPPWLEERALLMWVDYSVDGSCEPCDERVFDARFIPPPPSTRPVVFTTGDAFEATGAERISVVLRSPFLDPQRERIAQAPAVALEEDGVEYPIAQLFLTDREFTGAGAQEPFYEYRLEVVMRDGRVFESLEWSPSRSLDVLLGSAVIEQALGALPTQEAAAP